MELLTLEDVAKRLHWSNGTARNRISQGAPMPPYIKIGHRLLFPAKAFDSWLGNYFEEPTRLEVTVNSPQKLIHKKQANRMNGGV